VIHRDIKPENLLLDAGRDQVGDFGIGRVFDASTIEDTLTRAACWWARGIHGAGSAGRTGLDGRTDVYGLGCVLCEMLAGEPPEPRRRRQRRTAPQRIRFRRSGGCCPSCRPHWNAAVRRALAKTPGGRFTAAQAGSALHASATDRRLTIMVAQVEGLRHSSPRCSAGRTPTRTSTPQWTASLRRCAAGPRGLPTRRQLVEHLRLAQHDILDFCRNPDYEDWPGPDDYWPSRPKPPSARRLGRSIAAFRRDRDHAPGLALDLRPICSLPIPMAVARRCSASCCWWPITTPTASGSSSPCGAARRQGLTKRDRNLSAHPSVQQGSFRHSPTPFEPSMDTLLQDLRYSVRRLAKARLQ
jgi:serine/threonine protein kinase